jgi:hypothetical protein
MIPPADSATHVYDGLVKVLGALLVLAGCAAGASTTGYEPCAAGQTWVKPEDNAQTALDFAVGCRSDRPPQTVVWRFSVRDSFGRASNVIEKPVHCGICK